MRSCPSCGAEYTDKAVTCSDCQGTLVDGPADTAPDAEAELVRWERVYGAPDQVAAVMLQGVIEAEDIPVRVEANTLAGYGPLFSSMKADSWGSILVPAEHAEEATRLIDDYLQGLAEDAEDADADH
jgi:hypothetical protein